MSPYVKSEIQFITEAPVRCECGQCEEAVQDMIRMDQMLCGYGRQAFTRRRNQIRKLIVREYHRARHSQRRAS